MVGFYDALIETLQIAKTTALIARESRGHARHIERAAITRRASPSDDLLAGTRLP